MMKKTLLRVLVLAGAMGAACMAQSNSAYIFVASGGATGSARTEATLQAGAGFEAALPKGFGAGAEIGALSPYNSWGDATLGAFSATGYYHFRHGRQERLDPFVGAGYTRFFHSGGANLFHYAGGVNVWAARHVGVRFEFRDQVDTQYSTVHYWGVRFGVALR